MRRARRFGILSADMGKATEGMRIYVDMDDVLCETAAALCKLAEREFGRRVAYENVFAFDLQKVFCLSDREMKRFMELSHSPATLRSYAPTPGAAEALCALRSAGHEVEIVTGRPAYAHSGTEQWLADAGMAGFPVSYVDKYGRDSSYAHNPGDPPTATLGELFAERFDVAIDDSPQILSAFPEGFSKETFVFARPWNASMKLRGGTRRIGGWREIAGAILGRPLG